MEIDDIKTLLGLEEDFGPGMTRQWRGGDREASVTWEHDGDPADDAIEAVVIERTYGEAEVLLSLRFERNGGDNFEPVEMRCDLQADGPDHLHQIAAAFREAVLEMDRVLA